MFDLPPGYTANSPALGIVNNYWVGTPPLPVECPPATEQQIDTIVGTGTPGYSGNGGPALDAQINQPQGIDYDGAGNLYIADNQNFVIRKVNSSGVITTVAGNGTQGFSGDLGPAIQAQIGGPLGIAVSLGGDILFADQSNHRIRQVSSTLGLMSTVAGNGTAGFCDAGVATLAKLNNPQGVALHSSGDIIIADTDNRRVRFIDSPFGFIVTIAGNGAAISTGDGGLATDASLTSPRRVALDSAGNVYVLDAAANPRIRRIDAATGIITTVAGGGTAREDCGIATDLYLGPLTDLAVDNDDSLIITGAHQVWKVKDGIAYVIAGSGTPGYSGDGGDALAATFNNISGVAFNPIGMLVVADSSNNRIRKLGPYVPAPPCPADIMPPPPNGDGQVTIADINAVLISYGLPCNDCAQDIAPQPDGDDQVTIADVNAVLSAFGPCR